MALWKKLVLSLIVLVIVAVGAAVQAVVGWRAVLFGPKARALTERTFEATPERLERGDYLVNAVHGCVACHSERDWDAPGAPVKARPGAGTDWAFHGLPWLVASNITPDPETGIGNVSDDALARAIREGIGFDGRALFPIMPWPEYRRIPDEDLGAIIVYLRSLDPVRNELPRTSLPFPLSQIMKSLPVPLDAPVPAPGLSTPVERGEYLLRTAACHHCHTPQDSQGRFLTPLDMAGGFVLESPVGAAAATNLTPHATGLLYDEAGFLLVMRTGQAGAAEMSPVMPWAYYRSMTDEDLKAIYAYLRTLEPVKHVVNNTEPPTPCAVCGIEHGGGSRNGD
ncbi:MAG: cytochrome c [Acidobacteria bacterium]|nr:cytochrome c [Acidobacteriota bacterium]